MLKRLNAVVFVAIASLLLTSCAKKSEPKVNYCSEQFFHDTKTLADEGRKAEEYWNQIKGDVDKGDTSKVDTSKLRPFKNSCDAYFQNYKTPCVHPLSGQMVDPQTSMGQVKQGCTEVEKAFPKDGDSGEDPGSGGTDNGSQPDPNKPKPSKPKIEDPQMGAIAQDKVTVSQMEAGHLRLKLVNAADLIRSITEEPKLAMFGGRLATYKDHLDTFNAGKVLCTASPIKDASKEAATKGLGNGGDLRVATAQDQVKDGRMTLTLTLRRQKFEIQCARSKNKSILVRELRAALWGVIEISVED